nr:CehA/McbA family metallohydrolase [Butyrivibrio sp.]
TEGATIYYAFDDNATDYKVYDPENKPVLTKLPCLLTTYATKDGLQNSSVTKYKYSQQQVENVTAMPNGGAITENTQIKLSTKTEGAKIWYAYAKEAADENAEYEWIEYTEPFTAKELPCSIVTYASKEGCIDSAQKTLSFKKRLNEKYNIYFGQIHSHTEFSDGAGSCEQAFKHASTEVANLDYLAVTDHSNSLDNEGKSVISQNVDTSATEEWTRGHELAKQYSTDKFTCIYGYEMTWSNGLGHMNTYNTPGFQSRTQKAYSTYSTALKNYYDALNTVPDSVSMFNHPGTTFGDFQDFAYYSEANDELINLIEVGNGEGEIGSAGYFPSYEYYTRALDKGWHIAPTNNQDNHKGRWGDANTARTVALADANTESDIYDAMRNHRIYATEDNDLSIYYTLDGNIMGTILGKDAVGEKVHIEADVKDPTDGAVGKVSVIVNGGLAVASQNIDSSEGKASFDIDANYSYYYLRIDQKDGNIAVTAPVWVGDVEACGINGVSTTTTLPVRGENLDIKIDFYNNEKVPLEIEKVTIDVKNAQGVETNVANLEGDDVKAVASIGQNSTASLTYNHVYGNAGKAIYTVTAYGKLDGVDKVYTGKLEVNYTDPQMVGEVIIDGSHYNDYVGGYYAGNMNNFIKLCAEQNLRAKIVSEKVTAETLKGAKFFVIAPPASKDGEANGVSYTRSTYDDDFVNVVKEYVAAGGTVIITGIADYNNAYAATEQNKLLTAIGSTITVNSDECIDEEKNGGQVYRLYPENFKADSPYLAGVKEGQKYSQYSGCSVSFTEGENDSVYEAEKLVWGFESTYSKDCKDENGNKIGENENGVPLDNKGNVNFLVHQKTKAGGDIFVSGGVFVSDFEVKAEMDNNDSLPYLNYNIAKNIIAANQVELPVSKIADMRKGAHGDIFAVEGYVTAGTDKEGNKFFDTIYIQDDTAGVTVFPVAETGIAIGTKVRITGFVDDYQGDLEIQAYSYKILDDEHKVIEPKEVSTKDAADYDLYGGSLLKTSGVVTRVVTNDAGVDYFFVKDDSGVEARVFIDGYILSSTGNDKVNDIVKVGATVSAVGLSYMNPDGATLRVRDRDEIVLIAASSESGSSSSSESGSSSSSEAGSSSSSESGSSQTTEPGNNADAGNGSSVDNPSNSENGASAGDGQSSDTKKDNKKNNKKNNKNNKKNSKKESGNKNTKSEGNNTNSGSSNSSSQSSENVQSGNSSSTATTSAVNSSADKTGTPATDSSAADNTVVAKADNSKVTESGKTKKSETVTETNENSKEEASDEAETEASEPAEDAANSEESTIVKDTEIADTGDAESLDVQGAEINDEEAPLADTAQDEKSGIPTPVLVILLLACLAVVTGGAVVLVRKQNVK